MYIHSVRCFVQVLATCSCSTRNYRTSTVLVKDTDSSYPGTSIMGRFMSHTNSNFNRCTSKLCCIVSYQVHTCTEYTVQYSYWYCILIRQEKPRDKPLVTRDAILRKRVREKTLLTLLCTTCTHWHTIRHTERRTVL